MKLLTLNIWGGRVYEPFLRFIEDRRDEVDIFCFQEIFDSTQNKFSNKIKTNIYSDLKNILEDYVCFFAPTFSGYDTEEEVDFDLSFGQGTFIKKSVEIVSNETIFVHGQNNVLPPSKVPIPNAKVSLDLPRNIHLVKVKRKGKEIMIGNLHGYWFPFSKHDTPESIKQMKKVSKIFAEFNGPKIICGDFNLRPETKSIKMLEKNMRNLIVEYGIKSTRSKLHTREEKFADYIMVSDDVRINRFEVMDVHVSDHLPLLLEFDI